MSKRHWNKHRNDLRDKLIEAFKEAKICCVHNDGDDPEPCEYTTGQAIKIIDKIMSVEVEK